MGAVRGVCGWGGGALTVLCITTLFVLDLTLTVKFTNGSISVLHYLTQSALARACSYVGLGGPITDFSVALIKHLTHPKQLTEERAYLRICYFRGCSDCLQVCASYL